jgi:hypothetical protein
MNWQTRHLQETTASSSPISHLDLINSQDEISGDKSIIFPVNYTDPAKLLALNAVMKPIITEAYSEAFSLLSAGYKVSVEGMSRPQSKALKAAKLEAPKPAQLSEQ